MKAIMNRLMIKLLHTSILNWLPDESYLKLMYRSCMKKRLDLVNPKSYNEKLQWLKLFDRKDIYSKMVDKYEAKQIAESIIGSNHIIKTLGVWFSPNEINFESLPTKFVLKTTHDSGSIRIINKEQKFNKEEVIDYFKKIQNRNFYKITREWPYKNVRPRIIAEQYMEDNDTHELRDYKFFCFDGEVKALFIATDRMSKDKPTAFDFFDTEYQWLDIRHGHPNAVIKPEKPKNFELMVRFAQLLSKGLPHVRVDLYEINGEVYFGEFTFFHHGGFVPFDPEEWDYKFGEWLVLPTLNSERSNQK